MTSKERVEAEYRRLWLQNIAVMKQVLNFLRM